MPDEGESLRAYDNRLLTTMIATEKRFAELSPSIYDSKRQERFSPVVRLTEMSPATKVVSLAVSEATPSGHASHTVSPHQSPFRMLEDSVQTKT